MKKQEVGFKNLPPPATLSFEPTMFNCLLVSLPIAILVMIIVFLTTQKSWHDYQSDYLMATTILPSMTFLAVAIGGIVGSYVIPLAFNWVQFIGAVALGGIAGLSHSVNVDSLRLRDSTKIAIQKLKVHPERTDTMAKWLELEHADCQAVLQWIVWGSMIFITAGLVTWYTRPGVDFVPGLFDIGVLHALIIVIWAIVGLVFGMMNPLFQRMRFFREQIKDIACGDYTTD